MRNPFSSVLSFLLLPLVMACGQSPEDLAREVEKELGIPLELKTDLRADACALRQLSQFLSQYQELSGDEKEAIKEEFTKYGKITVNPSVEVQPIEGEVYILRWLRMVSSPQGSYETIAKTRTIGSNQGNEVLPRARLIKEKDLILTTESALDLTEYQHYDTRSQEVFNLVTSYDGPIFKAALARDVIRFAETKTTSLVNCGKLLDLKNLL